MKSGIAMVCVSGSKVRSLREEQQLTQLYLATAVGVTTETISRWERQESPTLKEENGLKLADALSVSLEEILFVSEKIEEKEEVKTEVESTALPSIRQKIKKILLFIIANTVLLGVCVFLIVTFRGADVLHLSAKRIMPAHSVAGYPFPVVIEVNFESEKNLSLLLKEQLPESCSVIHTVPQATVADDGFLKWIEKDGPGKRNFSYVVKCQAVKETQKSLSFEGTLLVRQSSRQEAIVDGRSRLRLLEFHWADSDKNNIVDDEELLAVYDDFGRIEGLKVDVEEVESIWMGSGYRWNQEQLSFDIIP
ncbi:MAG: helix-turn-helix transcriptional regulator [Desulfocapsa sp.]|nr:helix-turn-helix transcriptional regulator [Desulfocapsa sp.]